MRILTLALLLCACPSDARETVNVRPAPHYEDATKSAIKIINGFVGCKFLVTWGDEAEPDIVLDSNHAHESPWEARPNINTKACIAAHKIGHRLGLEHPPGPDPIGIMTTCKDPWTNEQNRIRVRDADVLLLKQRYCK